MEHKCMYLDWCSARTSGETECIPGISKEAKVDFAFDDDTYGFCSPDFALYLRRDSKTKTDMRIVLDNDTARALYNVLREQFEE